ncbi:hypothetical protein A2767_01135 [Candidatus Roizmanbacteria bacterium RIFCSPHIGHO2_01_FULL_35_10]|uniref:Uncharacterized protein n=1 Tax=Candidatus Roizmanbacteria bacterium RIFCSPLOWO2_01_FULL_35_13 TaxID=1802055 RepID=A0A1F7IC00_9BACT|nr:MAG: hypothetical protein A2767_01135 [Candidatus Roizmanbacteria bacterium RIFCSPHIGHO2_01_FULL_35_10]OGK40886.1 MAG: hypothetical protein A3A74_01505 [Candidatus Roizmanbacteria bacterium RIFCSPLOWO2_01_FULL_35_13]
MCKFCLKWNDKQYHNLSERILKLKKDQIGGLFGKVGIKWEAPIEEIVEEMFSEKEYSLNLNILLSEAGSKKNLIKWVKYYEKQNERI